MRIRRILRSPLLFWSAALVVAIATAAMLTRRAQQGVGERVVVVRSVSVRAAQRLRPADVELRVVPIGAVPHDAARTIAAVVGRAPREALVAGEVVRVVRLATRNRQGAAVYLTAGRRAIAIPAGDSALALAVGDHVDVLATTATEVGGPATTNVVSADALVIAVAERRITVSVANADAPELATALVSGTITLAQR